MSIVPGGYLGAEGLDSNPPGNSEGSESGGDLSPDGGEDAFTH